MDSRYQAYCVADPTFYDAPARAGIGKDGFIAGRSIPEGWSVAPKGDWTLLAPPVINFPSQGWKIHASATPDNARYVLDRVWDYCVRREMCFKFLSNHLTLVLRNAKYADRGGSGKFVTIYPATCDDLEQTLRELGAALDRQPGPYILSDARWGDGPLFVRYGGFLERWVRSRNGELVPAIEAPTGELVPDLRRPVFEVPAWVTVPDFLASHVAAREAGSEAEQPGDFPYRIERPLHFSNGGGVYLAVDVRTDRQVVLREARPCAGLDATGHDAVKRLERERDILTRLAGVSVVPRLYEYFTYWEHHFLAEEYVPGQTLGRHFTKRCPLIRADITEDAVERYTAWAVDVLEKVRSGLQEIHRAGVAFGDLHPHNILIQPDGQVRFVDFEMASDVTDTTPAGMGAPGFVAYDGRTGADADLYALACLNVSMFVPLNVLFHLSSSKPAEIVRAVTERFPVPPTYAADVLRELQPRSAGGPTFSRPIEALVTDWAGSGPDFSALRASMGRAILASATPEREDRLFPGDIKQFSSGGLGMAYGAAGVLYVLARVGIGRFPEHEQWLLRAVTEGRPEQRIGFYDGLHGIAYALEELGRRDDALALLEVASGASLDHLSIGLFDGLPGVGLNLLHFAKATGDAVYRSRAIDVADRLASGIEGLASTSAGGAGAEDGKRPAAGLMHGASGRALFYIRLFEATFDREFLRLAEIELQRDLDRCEQVADGSLQLEDGSRVLPYIAIGSAGIGLVLQELLIHRPQEEFANAIQRITRATEAEFVVQSGLFNGRAGLLTFLLSLRGLHRVTVTSGIERVIDRHVRRLAWHAVPHHGEVAFPGDQLQRLSMDLATGSAGVLLALEAARGHDTRSVLPFFSHRESPEGGALSVEAECMCTEGR